MQTEEPVPYRRRLKFFLKDAIIIQIMINYLD
jgi:hypothetical protein